MSKIPIVIVDDTEADRYIAKRQLRRSTDFSPILELATGYEFLDTFLDNIDDYELGSQPIVVLMDINMPRIDGFETIEELQKRMRNGTAPDSIVIMMFTSSDNPKDRARAIRLPAVKGYLVKPIDEEGVASIRAAYASFS